MQVTGANGPRSREDVQRGLGTWRADYQVGVTDEGSHIDYLDL
jgi:hypothetical protein